MLMPGWCCGGRCPSQGEWCCHCCCHLLLDLARGGHERVDCVPLGMYQWRKG